MYIYKTHDNHFPNTSTQINKGGMVMHEDLQKYFHKGKVQDETELSYWVHSFNV